jgi:hypothetical protein
MQLRVTVLVVTVMVAVWRSGSTGPESGLAVESSGQWSASPIAAPAGTRLCRSCVRLTIGAGSHEAWMDARSAEPHSGAQRSSGAGRGCSFLGVGA